MPLLIDWLVQPLGLTFAMLLIGLLASLLVRGVSFFLRVVLFACTLMLWACSAPLPANTLVNWMEKPRHSVPAACSVDEGNIADSAPSAIVVLGAGLDAYVDSENPYRVLSPNSLTRTLHAASLDTGSSRFYLMGGGQTSRKLSDFMAMVLIDQSIPDSRIVRDRLSESTLTNAERLFDILSADISDPVTLVTSSMHMNRAVAIFNARGFTVCPSPSATLFSVSAGWVGLLPYISGLNKSTLAFRELLATIKYRVQSLAAHTD